MQDCTPRKYLEFLPVWARAQTFAERSTEVPNIAKGSRTLRWGPLLTQNLRCRPGLRIYRNRRMAPLVRKGSSPACRSIQVIVHVRVCRRSSSNRKPKGGQGSSHKRHAATSVARSETRRHYIQPIPAPGRNQCCALIQSLPEEHSLPQAIQGEVAGTSPRIARQTSRYLPAR